MKRITLLVLLCFSMTYLFAGGYGVALQSQKFLGMAHAGTGLYLDGSAIFFNPGALAQQQNRWEFTFGIHPLLSKGYYQNTETRETFKTENPIGTPLELYASYKITDDLTAGFGFYTPFGNGLKWEDGWAGRALITEIKLKTYFLQPTLAYRVNNWLSVGAGVVIGMADVVLKKDIPGINGDLTLDGRAETKIGYNLGVYLQPTEKLSVGINYRSKLAMNAIGQDAIFTVPKALSGKISPNDTFNTMLPMVSSLNIGTAYRFSEKLTVAADVNFNNWSEYKALTISFDKNSALTNPQKRDFNNTISVRVGAQYQFNEKLTARAGFYFDPTPIQKTIFTPETPSMNNLGFTLGGSYQATKRLSVDFSFLLIKGLERSVSNESANFEGDFRTMAFSPGIGVSYSF